MYIKYVTFYALCKLFVCNLQRIEPTIVDEPFDEGKIVREVSEK